MQTTFEHKPDFRFRDFVIEKTVELPVEQFKQMLRHPMDDQTFLQENIDLMQQDSRGTFHCLLVIGEDRPDGILVQSEGYSYARYAAYVPETAALRFQSLSKMNRKLVAAVDFIIADGISQTMEGNWVLTFNELEKKTGLCVEGKPFLQELLGDMLSECPEVADVVIKDRYFDVDYCLDFCPNCMQEETKEIMGTKADSRTLRDLLLTPMSEVHLLHRESEIEPATIAELSVSTLSEIGKQEWADILDAKVCRIYQGIYGLQVELDNVSPARLQEFSKMLAGDCPAKLYDRWVAQPEETSAQSPTMKL